MAQYLQDTLAKIKIQLALSPRVAVLGSTEFWDSFTPVICRQLGESLAQWPSLSLLTGGVSGVPDKVAESFWDSRSSETQQVFHLQAAGEKALNYGQQVLSGQTMAERRWLLAHSAPVYVVLSGGPGTEQEARWALNNGAAVIPIGITKGVAKKLYEEFSANQQALEESWRSPHALAAWKTLNDFQVGAEEIVQAVCTLLEHCFDSSNL